MSITARPMSIEISTCKQYFFYSTGLLCNCSKMCYLSLLTKKVEWYLPHYTVPSVKFGGWMIMMWGCFSGVGHGSSKSISQSLSIPGQFGQFIITACQFKYRCGPIPVSTYIVTKISTVSSVSFLKGLRIPNLILHLLTSLTP